MPKFLFEASYTVEGVKGLRREGGSGRREAVARAAESVGGAARALLLRLRRP
jgi:uncharacterized protein with GYD domain